MTRPGPADPRQAARLDLARAVEAAFAAGVPKAEILASVEDADPEVEWVQLYAPRAGRSREVTVLVDDVRSFRDGRPAQVARSSAEALVLLQRLVGVRIEHLWLDHDLGGDDTVWPVVHALEDAALAGRPWAVGMVHVHASGAGPGHRVLVSMRRAGYPAVRSTDPQLWTW